MSNKVLMMVKIYHGFVSVQSNGPLKDRQKFPVV
jgi:hypothetical protein